jgi:hypothetical protein
MDVSKRLPYPPTTKKVTNWGSWLQQQAGPWLVVAAKLTATVAHL